MPRNQALTRGPTPMQPGSPEVQYAEDFYIYEVDFADLDAGENLNGNIQIQADSDFKWERAVLFADIAGAVQTSNTRVVPLVTVQVVDSGSGRQLFQSPVAVASVFGFGVLPFILPIPRIFMARSNIAISVANFSAATTYELRLSFIGTKIYQMG